MYEGDPDWCVEADEQFSEDGACTNTKGGDESFTARRKIERLRELRRLRVLLDDPEIDDLD